MYPGYALLFIFAEIMVKKMAVWSPVTQKKDYTYEEVQREARGGRSLFVIENKVCDLTKYMLHHPGKQLLDEYVGTEIGRYVYGGFPSKDRRVQFHTPEAFSIMQDQCCGTVRPILDLGVAPNSAWRIANRQSASKVHYIIQFASPPNKLPAILPGINFCGTYIKLKSRKLGVTRNYSWSFLNSRSVMKDHLELVKRVDDPGFTPPFPRISGVTKERIEICVKKQRLMSKWLQDKASDSDEFEIEGPFV